MTVPETGKVKYAKPVGNLFDKVFTVTSNRPTGRDTFPGPRHLSHCSLEAIRSSITLFIRVKVTLNVPIYVRKPQEFFPDVSKNLYTYDPSLWLVEILASLIYTLRLSSRSTNKPQFPISCLGL